MQLPLVVAEEVTNLMFSCSGNRYGIIDMVKQIVDINRYGGMDMVTTINNDELVCNKKTWALMKFSMTRGVEKLLEAIYLQLGYVFW